MFHLRCTWNGRPCNINQDFKTTITDLGVCYTFNYHRPSLIVREPGGRQLIWRLYNCNSKVLKQIFIRNINRKNMFLGSSNALRLLLNVEQYEIMGGPQIDAGVKVNNMLSTD